MSKTVKELFSGIQCTIIGNENEEVSGVAFNSRDVKPGDIFFCIVGLKADGHTYAQDAIDRGAKVLVCERSLSTADTSDVTLVMVGDSRRAMARIASRYYDTPSEHFKLVGITGTNGKTTTTYLVEHIAQMASMKTAVVGTVGIRIGDETLKSSHTTPESVDLQKLFCKMDKECCDVVAIEVSSHALDLDRVWASRFAVTAFTNLTQDHLDYHKTFESYFEAKARLFSPDYPAKRVICIDDKWGKELLRRCSGQGDDVITTGFTTAAQIHPINVEYLSDRTRMLVEVRGAQYQFDYPLVGKFNVSNIMTALGIGIQLGIPADVVVSALNDAPQIPGRLQRVPSKADCGFSVYVDYAHTPDALEKALGAVKAITTGRTIVVFGCGGDRDTTKRPIMGSVALGADYAIVTSDNPRTEDPAAIVDDILAGMTGHEDRYEVHVDRREGIAAAIAVAKPGDSILIAGKGHEDYQLVGDQVLSFDDVKVAEEELNRAFC
ncbi:MAG: UDP-N-acetylmuramoyl-L-alanyl-D-glutamate--2,6-diaminopimelate ligase [Eggerthellales bacterium]|nr:UDP-N-acetylmuramoyl-L-alanyl-D-glutamate--2,6-diaminopimelate ligase [Eggerthellales bacterium]